MTTPATRIEVITRGERRRRWSVDAKREIVAESLEGDVRPSEVIRKYGITSGQLYAWRQQLTRRVDRQLADPTARFARVDVVAGERGLQAAGALEATLAERSGAPVTTAPAVTGRIEIVLGGGSLVRVEGAVDESALRCVLEALRGR